MEAHLHRDCGRQRRLRRLSSQYWFASWLWQMHRDQVSPASRLLASVAASPPCRPVPGVPVALYCGCIEMEAHLHRDCGHQRRLRRLSSRTGVPVGYGRCIEIGSHLHCYCGHQRRLRRPVVQYRFASWLWQMHRDRVSPALLLRASEAASPPCRPSAGLPVGYGRCIEIGSHIAIAGIRGGFAVSSFRYWCTSGAMADT